MYVESKTICAVCFPAVLSQLELCRVFRTAGWSRIGQERVRQEYRKKKNKQQLFVTIAGLLIRLSYRLPSSALSSRILHPRLPLAKRYTIGRVYMAAARLG